MSVAQAIRRSQYNPGYVFGLVLSKTAMGQMHKVNTDRIMVSR